MLMLEHRAKHASPIGEVMPKGSERHLGGGGHLAEAYGRPVGLLDPVDLALEQYRFETEPEDE